jgi:hypothetical protein
MRTGISKLPLGRLSGLPIAVALALGLAFVAPNAALGRNYTGPLPFKPTFNHLTTDVQWKTTHWDGMYGYSAVPQEACYYFSGSWSPTFQQILANEMAYIGTTQSNVAQPRAILPTFWVYCPISDLQRIASGLQPLPPASRLMLKWGGTPSGADGFTRYAQEIDFSTTPGTAWCTTRSQSGCAPIDGGLVHELGHALGLEHQWGSWIDKPYLVYTRMGMGLNTQDANAPLPYFGTCDLAGLQGIYGIAPGSVLSSCYVTLNSAISPTLSLTQWTVNPAGSSAIVRAQLTGLDWSTLEVNVYWYDANTGAKKGPTALYAGGLRAEGITIRVFKEAGAVDQPVGTMSSLGGGTYGLTIPSVDYGSQYYAQLAIPLKSSNTLSMTTY